MVINKAYRILQYEGVVRWSFFQWLLLFLACSVGISYAIHPNDGKKEEKKPDSNSTYQVSDSVLARVWLDSAKTVMAGPHPDDALAFIQKTIELSRSIQYEPGMVGAYLALSDLYGQVSMTSDQLQVIELASTWSAGRNMEGLHTLSSHKLADYYLSMHNLDDAELAYQNVYQKYSAVADSAGMASVLSSLGDIRKERDLFADAGKLYEDALKIQVRYHLYDDITTTYLKLVSLELEGNNLRLARKYLGNAAHFAPYAADSSAEMLAGIAFVKYYLAGMEYDSARYVSEKLLASCGTLQASDLHLQVLQQLYRVHREMDNDESAWEIYTTYDALKKDFIQKEDAKRASIYAALSGLQNISRELDALHAGIDLYQDRQDMLNGVMMVVVIMMLFTGFGGVYLHSQYEHLLKVTQRMQQRVSRQSRNLADTNRFMEEFSYMTAHDLRSPVTNLLGLLSIVKREEIADPENHRHFLSLKRGSYRMLHVLNNLNDILRMRQLTAEKPEWIDLNQLAQSVAGHLKGELEDFHNPVTVTAETGASVLYPRRQLESILQSLLMFSASRVKPSPSAPIWITAANEGAYSRITCAYPVHGISPQESARIFNLGEYQDHSSEDFPTGLYNIQLLASAHGGSVAVSDMAGGGNLFTVLIRNFAS